MTTATLEMHTLTATDRCDVSASEPAQVLTAHETTRGMLTLAWCKHHFDRLEHDPKFDGVVLIDNRAALAQNRLVGAL